MAILVEVPAFEITERSGAERKVVLRGRALPYQGASFNGSNRLKKTTYQGNPVATIQVLGPVLEATEIHGMWKSRFLPGQVELTGFPGIDPKSITAEELIGVFESLRDAAQQVVVNWGPVTRYGVIESFKPNWIRLQDVEWSLSFEWSGSMPTAPRAATITEELPAIQTAQAAFDASYIEAPATINPTFLRRVQTRVNAMRASVGTLFDAIRTSASVLTIPQQTAGAALSAVNDLTLETESLVSDLANIPYTYAQTSDSVVDVLKCEGFRRTMRGTSRKLEALSRRQAQQFAQVVYPGSLAVVTVSEDTSLRSLSVAYYGTADSWQLIADRNNLPSSFAPAGSLVIIPAVPQAAPVRTVAR